jgi:hypothetical protein
MRPQYPLVPVDETKLNESERLMREAEDLRRQAEQMLIQANRLRREHYTEQYDRCRGCNGHGVWGEGLGVQVCPYCTCGLLPKGTIK